MLLRIALALLFVGTSAAAAVAKPLGEDWLRTANEGWATIVNAPSPCQCNGEMVMTITADTARSSTYRFRLKRRGEAITYEEERNTISDGKARLESDVWGVNSDYRFHISRKTAEHPWVVRELVRSEKDDASDLSRNLRIYTTSIDLSAVLVYDESLPEIFASPYIKIKSADEIEKNGRPLARVSFEFLAPKGFKGAALELSSFGQVVGGTLWLDPNQNWRAVEAQLLRIDKAKVHITYSVTPTIPKLLSARIVDGVSPEISWTETLKYSEVSYDCDFSENDFRLPAYGLPEPPGMERASGFGLAWILGLAGVAIIVAGIWILRARGWKRASST